MTALGHEERFPPRRLNGRCRFSEGTFTGAHGNGRDAPIPDLPALALGRAHSKADEMEFAKGRRTAIRSARGEKNSLGQRLQWHLESDRQGELADHLTAMHCDECGSDDLSWLLPTYAREETRESHAMPHLFLKSDRPGGVLGIPCEPQYHQEKESLMGSIILRPGMCDQRRLFNTKFFRVGQEMSRSRGQTPPDAYTPSV